MAHVFRMPGDGAGAGDGSGRDAGGPRRKRLTGLGARIPRQLAPGATPASAPPATPAQAAPADPRGAGERPDWARAGRTRIHRGPVRRDFANGRYRLDARLGGGPGSDLYRATDRLLRRSVAIKLYRRGAGSAAERQFRDESRQLAWLEHPNLVTLYDAGIEDGQPFLVLQFVDGVTLERRLEQGPLSAEQTAAVGARLADALAYVHERDVVHRDLRPSNVLVDENGVFISDFGISRMLGSAHLAASGLQTGTSAYLAPEQLRRGAKPRPQSDIYSLGLVLIECLTGEAQFPGGALASAVARLTVRPRIPEGLPEPMRDALEAMTSDDPARRPTAEECRAAFVLCDPEFLAIPDLEVLDCGPVADPVRPIDPDADTIADNVLFFPYATRWADPGSVPPAPQERAAGPDEPDAGPRPLAGPRPVAGPGRDAGPRPVAGQRPTVLRRAERISRMEPLAGARQPRPQPTRPHLRGWLKLVAASAAAAALATGLIQLESASADEGPGTSQHTP